MISVLIDPTWEELWQTPIGEWFTVFANNEPVTMTYLHIRGRNCIISIQQEPTNFNRGTFHAALDHKGLNIEPSDGWEYGRYYFDLACAKLEIEAWLKAWNQLEEADRA